MTTATITRTNLVPEIAVETRVNDRSVYYTWTDERPVKAPFLARGFVGNKTKHAFYHSFRSIAQRESFLAQWTEASNRMHVARTERMAEQKAQRAAVNALVDMPVGTVVMRSWGHEQTNVDFYKVIGHTGRTRVQMIEIDNKISNKPGTNAMAAYVVADLEAPIKADAKVLNCTVRDANTVVMPFSYSKEAARWDGKPCYTSWYA